MKSFIKWPGGKDKEWPIIKKYLPQYTGRYIEPFVGGGAIFFNINNSNSYLNDKSIDLINLYICIQQQDKNFINTLKIFYSEFQLIGNFIYEHDQQFIDLYNKKISINQIIENDIELFNSIARYNNNEFINEVKKNIDRKIKRCYKLEEKTSFNELEILMNLETAIKSSYYMYIRWLFNNNSSLNNGERAAIFFFIREYCYSSMFRYNKNGEFNVPYGGMSYNKKDFAKKINYISSEELVNKLNKTFIDCEDFEVFLDKLSLQSEDFIFLDPPYDTKFSTYDNNNFDKNEQIRLFNYLKRTPAKFMLIIKYTDFIFNIYKNSFNITFFDKKYNVSFMNRNDKDVEHMIITNYEIKESHL